MTAQQLQDLYNQPTAGPVDTRRVTMDDVIMKTLGLFAIVLVTGAVGWTVSAANPDVGMALWFGGMIGTLALGLVIAFKKTLSVPLILLYAVVEGLFMGAVSQYFNEAYPGIVGQAVLATLSTFAGMFLAYRFGLIKVTAKFRRIMTMMIFGYFDLRDRQLHLRGGHRHRRSASAAAAPSASASRSSPSASPRSPSPSTSTPSRGPSAPAPRRSTRGSSRTASS